MPNADNYESVCYTNTFIKEAIIKIDFPAPVACLSENLHAKISKAALAKFPILEPQKVQSQEFQFSAGTFSANSREITQWTFHGKNREKTLIISPDTIIETAKAYKNYEGFSGDFIHVINAVREVAPEQPVSRVGVRYVNVIDIPSGSPLEWAEYVNEGMLGIIDLHKEKKNVTRAFHILEFNFDPINLRFQFGIANPDYPAVVKRKQFVLDLDAYSMGAFEMSEIGSVIENSHSIIQDFFEQSITDKTRKMMKPKKDGSRK